jgi:DNA modification methylase
VSEIIHGNCLEVLKSLDENSIDCCVTSPPYWGLRDYGVGGQFGLESTPDEYVQKLVEVFREVKRVLKDEGTLWLNLGDSYSGSMKGIGSDGTAHAGKKQATNHGSVGIYHEKPPSANAIGLKPKDLVGIPWRVAFALQADGWYLRSDIIWHKPNPMPESVRDRPTKAHEYIFLMSKSPRYYYDYEAILEPLQRPEELNRSTPALFGGRNKHNGFGTRKHSGNEYKGKLKGRNRRSVWTVSTKPFSEAHFATFPPGLIEPCILAGCPSGGVVLDPFFGAGTTGLVAMRNGRQYIGVELNEEYIEIAEKRLQAEQPLFEYNNT